jgi:hypothetical protein
MAPRGAFAHLNLESAMAGHAVALAKVQVIMPRLVAAKALETWWRQAIQWHVANRGIEEGEQVEADNPIGDDEATSSSSSGSSSDDEEQPQPPAKRRRLLRKSTPEEAGNPPGLRAHGAPGPTLKAPGCHACWWGPCPNNKRGGHAHLYDGVMCKRSFATRGRFSKGRNRGERRGEARAEKLQAAEEKAEEKMRIEYEAELDVFFAAAHPRAQTELAANSAELETKLAALSVVSETEEDTPGADSSNSAVQYC